MVVSDLESRNFFEYREEVLKSKKNPKRIRILDYAWVSGSFFSKAVEDSALLLCLAL